MDTQPSMPEDNSQGETPVEDKKTVIKAVTAALVILTVVGSLFLLIRGQLASTDPTLVYKTVSDARAKLVEYRTPRQVPDINFTQYVNIESRTPRRFEAKLPEFIGKPVFLTFWASWCQPCRKEMVVLDQMHDELSDLGLEIVPIMTADKAGVDGARFFYHGADIAKLPVYLDHGRNMLEAFQTRTLPSSFFIDATGKVIALSSEIDFRQVPAQDLLRFFAEHGRLPD